VRKRFTIGLLAAAVVAGLVAAKRHELLRFAIQEGAGFAGYSVSIGDLRVGYGEAGFVDINVARDGAPVFEAQRIILRYSLRDLLPGSRHLFGLTGVDVTAPKLTLTRFADGSYNLKLPATHAVVGPSRVNPVPLRLRVRVVDGQLELREPAAYDPSAKTLHVRGIEVDGRIDTAGLTRYRVHGAFAQGRPEPFTIAGRIDAIRGYAFHRARAASVPLRGFANFFADTPALRILHTTARNLDARLYALDVLPNVTPSYHVGLHLDVSDGRLALQTLTAPVQDFSAHVQLIDNVFFVRGARATLAGIPLRIEGGVYDITGALTGAAQLRIGVDGTGDLSGLRRAFVFARDQAISGGAHLGVLVHGPIGDPVIVARVNAARAFYRTMPFDALAAGVVYHSGVIALAPLRASYGGIALGARGTLQLGSHVQSQFALHVSGLASRLPYLDEMLGDEPIAIDATATGQDLLFHVAGSAASMRGVARLAALVVMNPNGIAAVEPFWFHTERGNFDGAYKLDRPRDTSAFWFVAKNLKMRAPAYKAFPGLPLPEMPPIDGRTVDIALAGGGAGSRIVLAGGANAADTTITSVRFKRIEAAFAGTMQHNAMNRLLATGPWGTFNGSGEFSGQRFVAYGAYRGTFEGLQPFLGPAITGHGKLHGNVGIAIDPARVVVVGSNVAMDRATLHDIPVARGDLTLAIEGNRLRLYSARAAAAGGDVVAAGTFSLAAPGARSGSAEALQLVANRLRAAALRGIGLPLDAGTLNATGALAAGAPLPRFTGAVAVSDGRIANFAIMGNGDIRLAGNAVALQRVVTAVGKTYARVDGSIGELISGSPAYGLDADVPAAAVAPALHDFGIPNFHTDGSFNAHLHISGRSLHPSITGRVAVPAGAINGLPFVDGRALLAADPSGVSIDQGAVQVGTTAASFTAVARPRQNAIALRAPNARLADFNNFFDTGDTLAGDGSLKFAAASRAAQVTTSGDLNVHGFRYRNLPIGDTRAVWSSARNVVTGALAVGGHSGMLRAHGSIALPAEVASQTALQSALLRSRFNLTGAVNDLDLALWMPALGMQSLPLTGRVSGDAILRGSFPLLDVRGNASLDNGTLGPLELQTAKIAVHAARQRIIIDRAELTTPELEATASGNLGLEKDAALDVKVHASTNELAKLVYKVSHVRVPVTGSFESTLNVGGTYQAPTLLAGFDATGVRAYGISIAALFGEVQVHRRALVLSNVGADFGHGELSLAGSLPLSLAPLRLAAPDQPVSFDLDVVGLDPSVFDNVLGSNTKMGGLIDGHIGLSGTIRQPTIFGSLSLAHGSYVSDLQRVPITQIAAALAFDHTSASIRRVVARLGQGSVQASGSVDFPNGFSGGGQTLQFNGGARGAQLDLPAYGSGTLDAQLNLSKRPQSQALLAGSVTLSNATLPFLSFYKAAQASGSVSLPPLPLAFDLQATAGKNVRVRGSGYGAGLDIGAAGTVQLSGTLSAPKLSGTIESTGGTLTYFDRAFRMQQGSVSFNPAEGIAPTLHAVAASSVVDPDPDRARNPYGSAEVTISVDGPIQSLRIGLTSNPPGYSRDEILGLIAPFGGFVSGIGFSPQSMLARQSPSGITPLGALSPIPDVSLSQRSSITVGQEAFNILNAQFTAGLLAPLESTLGQGLGLSSINLTLGYYGNVGFTATRLLGRAVSAVYAVTFGLPQIQSFGLTVQPNPITSATLNFFYQSGPTKHLQ